MELILDKNKISSIYTTFIPVYWTRTFLDSAVYCLYQLSHKHVTNTLLSNEVGQQVQGPWLVWTFSLGIGTMCDSFQDCM